MRVKGDKGGGGALDDFLTTLLTYANWTQAVPSGYSSARIITFSAEVGKKYLIVLWSIFGGAQTSLDPTGCTVNDSCVTNISNSSYGYGTMRMYEVTATSTTVSLDTNIGTGTIWYQVVEL